MELSALVKLCSESEYQGRSQAGQYYNSSTGLGEASVLLELGLEQVLLNSCMARDPVSKIRRTVAEEEANASFLPPHSHTHSHICTLLHMHIHIQGHVHILITEKI